MSRRTAISFEDFFDPDRLASDISNKYWHWESRRNSWLSLTKESRDYIFATDTRTTTSGGLGWKNSTHLPKLCQIRDNLHANYMAAVFPNDRAITFESDDPQAFDVATRTAVEAYMRNKLNIGGFRTEVQKCILDWIDYGNCFAMVDFVNETRELDGEQIQGFRGPQMKRISPLDIVFDPTSTEFERTPKIVRELTRISDLALVLEDYPEMGYLQEVFTQVLKARDKFLGSNVGKGMDVKKNAAYQADGFSSFTDYFESDYIELLHFYGDIYDRKIARTLYFIGNNKHFIFLFG